MRAQTLVHPMKRGCFSPSNMCGFLDSQLLAYRHSPGHNFASRAGSTYQTRPHPSRYSRRKPVRHTLKRLSIVRTIPNGPDRNDDGCAGGVCCYSTWRPGDPRSPSQEGGERRGRTSCRGTDRNGQIHVPSPRKKVERSRARKEPDFGQRASLAAFEVDCRAP